MNKLGSVIPNPRINCRKLGLDNIDYRLMMSNTDIEFKYKFTDRGKLIKEETDPMIVKYCELNSKHHLYLKMLCALIKLFLLMLLESLNILKV